MTKESSKDAGTIQLLLERLNTERLPQALKLKGKVDRGDRLDDYDLQFLNDVFNDATSVQHMAAKHPEYQDLVGRLVSLYGEITRKALENEKQA